MVLNLGLAVILQGYEEGRSNEQKEDIDKCIEIWKEYDTERRMVIPLDDALKYINDAIRRIKESKAPKGRKQSLEASGQGEDKSIPTISFSLRMKFARAVTMTITSEQQVTFMSATRQVLRLLVLNEINDDALAEIDGSDLLISKKEKQKLQNLENRSGDREITGESLVCVIAAMKIQRGFRSSQARKRARAGRDGSVPEPPEGDPAGRESPAPPAEPEGPWLN
jgi:hypothetical protein